jgi:hypothetical protein
MVEEEYSHQMEMLREQYGDDADASVLQECLMQIPQHGEENRREREKMEKELEKLRARKARMMEKRKKLEADKKQAEEAARVRNEEEHKFSVAERRLKRAKATDDKEAELLAKLKARESLDAEYQQALDDFTRREAATSLCLANDRERLKLALKGRIGERRARQLQLNALKSSCKNKAEAEELWKEEGVLKHASGKDKELLAALENGLQLSDEEKDILAKFLANGILPDGNSLSHSRDWPKFICTKPALLLPRSLQERP